jgi:DNA helicase-2/ATP-dependent DNA helicase PcrA
MMSQSNVHVPAQMSDAPYLAQLNAAQREAVEALDGPVLVLAGAGTGKTRVLTARLVHLIATRRAGPGQILAVTFTNKAAREMRDRIAAMLGTPVEGWWLGTFHALAARLLRRHAEEVGLKSNFTILDTDDQIRLIKQLLQAENIDDKRWPARVILGVIERWKDRALTPDKLKPEDGGDVAGGKILQLYAAYQERLKTLNAADFGDLMLHNITLFQNRPDVLADYHRRFRYLLVDEYQDTNVAQYLWLRLLAQASHNICCVGDDDQSIYGWRGAEVGNILRFETDFPGAKIIRLEQNYRSTSHILAAASGVIAHNQGRLGKTLWTDAEGGEKVRIAAANDGEEEARFVGEEIESLQRKGFALRQIAVLMRAGFQTREFEERFLTLGVPYRVVGGPRFYERLEIRDALAYFRVIAQPADDLAFERIINTPKRGIGDSTLQTLRQAARALAIPLTEAAWRLTETDELKPRMRTVIRALMQDIARWRAEMERIPHTELARIVLDESGYTAMWQADKSPEAPGRLENLKELVAAMADFETLGGFLEHISLVMETQDSSEGDMVTLMTLHSAKGLEFDIVFLPGWEEGLFPHQRAMDESGIAGLEEERRLAYVGLTRARQRASVSYAHSRRVYGNWTSTIPSRFIDELPGDHIEIVAEPPLFGESAFSGTSFSGGGFDRWARDAGVRLPRAGSQPPSRVAPIIDGHAFEVPQRSRPKSPFAVGARIFHQKFGYGAVVAVDNDKLEIAFDHSGIKKVMDSFVTAADNAG